MGLFSSPPALLDEVEAVVSPFLFEEAIGEKTQQGALARIAKSQDALLAALKPREELIVIVPCYAGNTGYGGLAVVTTERLLHFIGSRIVKEIPRTSLADVERMASPHGTFLLALISEKAAPFSQFANGDLRNRSTKIYWEGTIQVPMLTQPLMDDFVQKAGFSREGTGGEC
jgi:hypothetical protein